MKLKTSAIALLERPPSDEVETALTAQMQAVSLYAASEADMTIVSRSLTVDITSNVEARKNLLRIAPQINPISTALGNGPSICGGTAIANALILSSKTPDKAQANAYAIQNLAETLKPSLKMSDEEQDALKRFAIGILCLQDAQHMQQVMYRITRRMPIGRQHNSNLMGVSTTQVATTIAALKSRGAFQSSSVTMHCHRQVNGFDHWTTTVDGTYVNSYGPRGRSIVHGGPPPELSRENSSWQNEIWLNPWTKPVLMSVQYRNPNDTLNEYRETVFQAEKYIDPESFIDLEERLFKAKKLVDD